MSIATAETRNGFVYVTNDKGVRIQTIPCGNGPNDGVTGYTSSTVSVRKGDFIYTYNEKGQQISAVSAK